jgi:predicted Zn-dependent protease
MSFPIACRPVAGGLTRRRFLRLLSWSAMGLLTACATDPVTGRKQLMMVSEDDEIQIDRQYSPMQISADCGQVQDATLNDYLNQVGKKMAAKSHRPQMPYSFWAVNATYVNAYAFPAGTIACTRGILLALENEAELAALLGHELGHVNARHTAEQMSKGSITQAILGGISILAGTQGAVYGDLAAQLGGIGAGALLASYSRDNEREADALGMAYMVDSGYRAEGMVGLMDILRQMKQHEPSVIELMFATHPMSDERYETAVRTAAEKYPSSEKLPLYRERYMDHTARLRRLEGAVNELQRGQKMLGQKKYAEAETHYSQALKLAPDDYAALVMMTELQLVQKNFEAAARYSESAKQVYPEEAQAYFYGGVARLQTQEYERAYRDFDTFDQKLPGNPNILFFKGFAREGMQQREKAANLYHRFLQQVRQGNYAEHAYQRLKEWGYYR